MKKLLFIFPLLFCYFGCEKDNNQNDNNVSIVGEWRLTNWEKTNVVVTSYVDPISGFVTNLDSSIVELDVTIGAYGQSVSSDAGPEGNWPTYVSFDFSSDGELMHWIYPGSYTKEGDSLFIDYQLDWVTLDAFLTSYPLPINEYNITLLNNDNLSFSGTNPYPRLEFSGEGLYDCCSYYSGDTLFKSISEDIFEFERIQ